MRKTTGGDGIPQATQHAGEDVVKGAADNARKEDNKIGTGHIINLRRGAQGAHHRRGDKGPHNHDEDGGDNRGSQGCAHGFFQALPVLGAKVLGHHDAGAHGNAHKQHQQQVQNGTAGAHGGQGVVSHIVAHHDGIHRAVKLLGQVADEQRDREPDKVTGGAALGHILAGKQRGQFSRHTFLTPFRCMVKIFQISLYHRPW